MFRLKQAFFFAAIDFARQCECAETASAQRLTKNYSLVMYEAKTIGGDVLNNLSNCDSSRSGCEPCRDSFLTERLCAGDRAFCAPQRSCERKAPARHAAHSGVPSSIKTPRAAATWRVMAQHGFRWPPRGRRAAANRLAMRQYYVRRTNFS